MICVAVIIVAAAGAFAVRHLSEPLNLCRPVRTLISVSTRKDRPQHTSRLLNSPGWSADSQILSATTALG